MSQKWLILVDLSITNRGFILCYMDLSTLLNNSRLLLSQYQQLLPHLRKNSWLYGCCDIGLCLVQWVSDTLHDFLCIFDSRISCKSYILKRLLIFVACHLISLFTTHVTPMNRQSLHQLCSLVSCSQETTTIHRPIQILFCLY